MTTISSSSPQSQQQQQQQQQQWSQRSQRGRPTLSLSPSLISSVHRQRRTVFRRRSDYFARRQNPVGLLPSKPRPSVGLLVVRQTKTDFSISLFVGSVEEKSRAAALVCPSQRARPATTATSTHRSRRGHPPTAGGEATHPPQEKRSPTHLSRRGHPPTHRRRSRRRRRKMSVVGGPCVAVETTHVATKKTQRYCRVVVSVVVVVWGSLVSVCVRVAAGGEFAYVDVSPGARGSHIGNVSDVIEDLLDGYDIRLRPQFGGDPVDILMEISVASFDSISEVNMDYTITIYLNQYWKDDRLSFSDDDKDVMTLTGDFAEKIWIPDTFFANDKYSFLHDVTEKNKMVRLMGDGSIAYGMRFTTTLACMMDLHNYPMDVQNCTVEIESYGYPMQDVVMRWKNESIWDAVHGVEDVEIPQFTMVEHRIISTVEVLATGKYQRLSLSFRLERNIGFFIFQNYLPSILIVMLSWVSFWINHEASSARVALGITTVLTMTTISTGVRYTLPRISYIKAIDIYLVMCFVFVFAALLEYAAVNYTYWGAKAKRKAKQLKLKKKATKRRNTEPMYPSALIELHDIQLTDSPIASLRNRGNHHHPHSQAHPHPLPHHRSIPSTQLTSAAAADLHLNNAAANDDDDEVLNDLSSTSGVRSLRGGLGQMLPVKFRQASMAQRRRQLFVDIKRRAREIKEKIPTVKDVNNIDKYSRTVFPTLFVLFNVGYWCFYLLQKMKNRLYSHE